MRRGFRLLVACTLLAALNLSAVLAQDAEALQRYETALENLRVSVESLPADSAASLDALEGAASSLRRLSQDTSSSNLVAAMERGFANARIAITNQSQTDLAVQTAVLRGGFQRGLLEASLDGGTVEAARPGLSRLVADLGLDIETLDQLSSAQELPVLLRAYQAGVARGIAERLQLVQSQYPQDRHQAYITLAGAYGMFLGIQDAPQAAPDLNGAFESIIAALVADRGDDVLTEAGTLSQRFTTLGNQPVQAAATPEVPAAPETPSAPETTEPAAEPVVPPEPEETPVAPVVQETPAEQAGQEVPETPVVETPVAEPTPEAETPETVEPPAESETEPAQAEAPEDQTSAAPRVQDEPTAPATDVVRAVAEADLQQQRHDALVAELARRGLRGQPGETVASQLLAQGYTSLGDVLDQHYALAGRAGDAVFRGDQTAARAFITELDSLYDTTLSGVITRLAPHIDQSTQSLNGSLLASPALRTSDVQALTAQVRRLGDSIAGSSSGLADEAQAGVTRYWAGWPRMIITVLAALLAILPLVLLRMAFGGGNRNWSLIGAGLFLLLLPVMLEGFAQLADLIARVTGADGLHVVAGWTFFQNPLMQSVWLFLTLAAIILISIGLYGICRQFGLFGGSEGSGPRLFRARERKEKVETKTLVDWDEEF